mgnify:CR=1 FL=1
MRQLGILGGMSWESTASYYRLLNQGVREQLGGLHSAPLLLHSVDFAEIAELQRCGDWQAAGQILAQAAQGLEQAGATALLLATNTMHKVAPAIEAAVQIPLLHIGDAVGQAIARHAVNDGDGHCRPPFPDRQMRRERPACGSRHVYPGPCYVL